MPIDKEVFSRRISLVIKDTEIFMEIDLSLKKRLYFGCRANYDRETKAASRLNLCKHSPDDLGLFKTTRIVIFWSLCININIS